MDGSLGGTHLDALVARLLARWPDHAGYIVKSFEGRGAGVKAVSDELARIVLVLGEAAEGGIDALIDDYRYLCETIVLPEELHFRRHGTYRLANFADAERECYANPRFMNRYMNGLLVSDVMWSNHAHAFASYANDYLPRLPAGAAHLEIGPGHGLFLFFAAREASIARVEGWDVSPTSIANTRAALTALGVERPVELKLANLFEVAPASRAGAFDSIVMSEILEHLEDPVAAMRAAAGHLKPGGHLWVNVPANSPAPDHIFLVNGPDHAVALVREAGLEVVDSAAFPMSGATLGKAVKRKLAISCVVLARKPAADHGVQPR
ncbi:MAG: class I SAM-dependent methyltransferase [Pseudomonadota bacterium]|nr:class I SAM-dependent methyltransferase [Pseudomonadota bacterium]